MKRTHLFLLLLVLARACDLEGKRKVFYRNFQETFAGIEKVPVYEAKEGFKTLQTYKANVLKKMRPEFVILSASLEASLIQVRWFEQRKDGITVSHELTGTF